MNAHFALTQVPGSVCKKAAADMLSVQIELRRYPVAAGDRTNSYTVRVVQ
jgi:hypothetical protein